MISSIKKHVQSPLEAEYKELRKLPPENSILMSSAAHQKTIQKNIPVEDIVTLSSNEPRNEITPAKSKPSQPVTLAERQALLEGFSIYV